jgi:hypothetical protein
LISVELASEVTASLRAMKDRGTPPPRCHKGVVQSAIAGGVRRLIEDALPGGVWIVFRGVDDEWRLVRFADDDDVSIRTEAVCRVELHGGGPDSVLAVLVIAKPDGVDLEVVSEDLGQGETETSCRYHWTEGRRSILAEEIKNEIYDGATPYTTYVRGVIVDGDRGVLLTGRDDSALVIEG